jgi:hypothetical protein
MFVTCRRILILAVLLSAASWSGSAAADCLYYGDVNLTGRLVQQTYAGPPDFESVTKGDKPLVIWVLQLDPSVCIVRPGSSYTSSYGEREIQLVLGDEPYARTDRYAEYRHLLGKRIDVSGRLLPGGGKYEKRYVIAAQAIKELF